MLCLLMATVMAPPAHAADSGRTITLGESNTPTQRDELLAYFGAGDEDRISDVTLDDTRRAMEGIIDVSAITSAYSSTALTCRSAGTGLEVTTRNIEVVPPALYAMALATAGIDDAMLVVAAPDDAPAEGMTALTGVFQTWDLAPCGGASLDPDRQALALEELALAMRIGDGIDGETGSQDATDLLLAIQQRIIVDDPEGRAGVVAAVEAQERATGITVPEAERDELIDLMAPLASDRLAWGSFGDGWRLTRGDEDNRVTLRALAADEPVDAGASSSTETPATTTSPTATPSTGVFTVTGSIDGMGDDRVVVGGVSGQAAPVTYPVADGVVVRRQGAPASLDEIVAGDTVAVTVDRATGRATAIDAEPATAGAAAGSTASTSSGKGFPLARLGMGLVALGLLGGLLVLLRRRRHAVPISFTSRTGTSQAVVSAVRQQVVNRTARVEKTSWYRPRHRPGHSDGSAD